VIGQGFNPSLSKCILGYPEGVPSLRYSVAWSLFAILHGIFLNKQVSNETLPLKDGTAER
jgi:hypothetical protein